MHLRKLYKRTSTGATQEWHKEIDGNRYRTYSGQVGGKIVTSSWKVAQPKNVGKSNETTGAEQAALEVEAEYTKKLSSGYFDSSSAIDDETSLFKPMLAKDYNSYPVTSFTGDVFSQPKLDGARCIAKADGLFSRTGKDINSVPHIREDLEVFFRTFPDMILDGELYADKDVADFNTIMSLVRKADPTEEGLAASKAAIKYHVYDYPTQAGPFRHRIHALNNAALLFGPSIVVVETKEVDNHVLLNALNADYLREGYEGQMVRVGSAAYENKRSKSLLKRKEFKDDEYKVVAITEGEGNRSGMAGFITYELGDPDRPGATFKSGIRGSHDYCKTLLANADNYIGGLGTVRYFELTTDGIPRFPVTVNLFQGLRDI